MRLKLNHLLSEHSTALPMVKMSCFYLFENFFGVHLMFSFPTEIYTEQVFGLQDLTGQKLAMILSKILLRSGNLSSHKIIENLGEISEKLAKILWKILVSF